ncbi:hypothetical protein KY284_030200 [Solanum tuberosum]|nr:hypothetical protein KY284_030200 [Solanum tuberosum]
MLVKVLENCKPLISSKVVTWECPSEGKFKCNSDGTFKHMLGVSSIAFCIWNHYGDFIFAKTRKVELISALEAEVRALGVDSLVTKKVLDGVWEVPWSISVEVRGTNRIFNSLQELPQQAMAIIQLEKIKVPNLRIQKYQNHRVHNMNGG